MNIAFYTYKQCCPSKGGIQRTTALVANALHAIYGCNVFSIFSYREKENIESFNFEDSLYIEINNNSDKKIVDFIKIHNINVIINQGSFGFGLQLARLIKEAKLNCIQIFAFHVAPGKFEQESQKWESLMVNWQSNKNIKQLIKLLFCPIYRIYLNHKCRQNYSSIEGAVDKIVLLSPKYFEEWHNLTFMKTRSENLNKFTAIPNAASYNHFSNQIDIRDKEKRVLIVARLEELPKKISKALKIWKRISSNPQMQEWSLDIVGAGPDQKNYEDFVAINHIPRVTFWGHQNPVAFYEKSSIFLMTSAFEGFPMTIVEASQYGVVPFALNTFASISDIITNKKNGFIFDENDLESYGNQIINLAINDEERYKMAQDAVENSKRFSIEKIVAMWHSLILELISNKQLPSAGTNNKICR